MSLAPPPIPAEHAIVGIDYSDESGRVRYVALLDGRKYSERGLRRWHRTFRLSEHSAADVRGHLERTGFCSRELRAFAEAELARVEERP